MPEAARTLRPEDEISHYRIVGPLGAGGMGEVYLAQDRTLERNVALKILPPDLVRSEERVRRFVLEAKSASSLSHPNIVTIYEIGQDAVRTSGEPDSSPMHFISMELVSGKTLSTLIHEDRTDLRTLLGYLAQAADGLAKAHAAGIVHRDLKPGNIMVSADGFAKVLDFGLAKLTEKREVGPETSSAPTMVADATGEGIVVGTTGYMSPEHIQGRAVDHRSDIFSFGSILYEAATRRRPFSAETGVETMHKILNEKPVPVEEINPKAPAELRRLIRRCLAKSPEQRLQSMKDLAIELREIVDEYDALSASASSGSNTGGGVAPVSARRSPVGVWIAAAIVTLAVAGLGWWGLQRGGRQSPAFQAMRTSTLTSRGDVFDAVLSRDGRFLAYLAGRAGSASLRVRQVATGSDVEVVPATDVGLENPSFSPDGNYLFYTTRKREARSYRVLQQVPSLGGTPQERAFDVDSRVTFSPDGKQLAFWRNIDEKSKLAVVDLPSGKERILASIPPPEFFTGPPTWSPDGKRIAAVLQQPTINLSSVIVLFDPATGRRQEFKKLPQTTVNSLAWLQDGSGLVASMIDLKLGPTPQMVQFSHPGAGVTRVTNDFSDYTQVSTSSGDEAMAAVRATLVANFWITGASGGPARAITSSTSPDNTPTGALIADSNLVLFTAPRDSRLQIWAISSAGGEPRPLTSGDEMTFRLMGGEGVIVYDRVDASGVHVWRMNRDGSGARQLTSGAFEQPMGLSVDGRWLAFVSLDSSRIFGLMSLESGEVRKFGPDIVSVLGFSPDGKHVCVGRRGPPTDGVTRTLWEIHPVTGGAPVATYDAPNQAANLTWNPDGRGVTFNDTDDPGWNVYRQNFDGGPPTPVTRFTEGRITTIRWSPDGKKLAMVRRIGANSNAWVTEADGSRPVQVTHFSTEDVFYLRWFPDSHRLLVSAGKRSQDAVVLRSSR